MEKALAVANEIILLAKAAGNPPTQMKLQKLMFFAHGWHLALADTPLIDKQFQAWKYGPVIPSVYHEFKKFGVLGITSLGLEEQPLGAGRFQLVPPELIDVEGFAAALLRKIWEVFGSYSGNQLSSMTHAPDTPWTKAREKYGDKAGEMSNIPIYDDDIKAYFKSIMSEND